ncbi:MAG: NHLP leader peptide family natural product precursor [Rhodoplanes sp.]|uniref:NHLP leader peptide family RiPP precursor n=1 Tax=Rhodoplanes sp. TaxID=1968906 RepID=UPI001817FD76|nr:NHLP leader peptide family RiPP precursor [Rhodoplanes sp.]NVO17886.1 NHLP leader peptide family natural product precursor [Rhodoplanes sp.]
MTNDELERKRIEIISKAWTDDSFKEKLLSDPVATLKAEGVELPAGLQVRMVENTENVFHFVLPLMPKELTNEDLDQVAGGVGRLHTSSIQMSDAAGVLGGLIHNNNGC